MVQDDSGELGPRAFPYGKTVGNGTNCLIKEANSTFACCWKNLPCPHLPLLIHTYFLGSPFSLQSKKMPPASPPFHLSLGSSDSPAQDGDEDSSRCHSPWDRGDTGVRGDSQLWSQRRLQQQLSKHLCGGHKLLLCQREEPLWGAGIVLIAPLAVWSCLQAMVWAQSTSPWICQGNSVMPRG